MKNAKSNFKIISLLLFISAVICLLLSVFLENEETATVFRRIGLLLLTALIIQTAFFNISPESHKTKEPNSGNYRSKRKGN